MRIKKAPFFAASLAVSLTLVAALFATLTSASHSSTPLPNFNGTHSGPRASATVVPDDRPVIFKIDETRSVNPSQLPQGGSATFSTRIRVNPYAANWTTTGNLITVGMMREVVAETRDGNTPFLPAHDGDPVIWFQNNNPSGVGMCWDKQFLVNNNFAFTSSGVSQCGLPQDDATQTGAAPGSLVNYSVTVFSDNTYRLVVEHLDANGNRVTNPAGLSPAANPYVISGALPHAANSNYFPFLRLRVGRDTGGNGIADPETNWEFQISDSQFSLNSPVVVRPDSLQGWQTQVSGTGQSVTFVPGPSTPPLSTGSVQLSVGPDGDGAAQLSNPSYAGTLLGDLTELSYSSYVQQFGSGGQAPYIILHVDHDNNSGTPEDLLFFEPVYQSAAFFPGNPQPSVALNTWQTWDALRGGWWSVNGFAGATPGTGVKSLAAYTAAFPSATIVNSGASGGVRIVAGFGAPDWNNFIGNVDAFKIGVSLHDTTFDFEPIPCGSPTNVALASYGATATASSQYGANFPASGVINGEHNGAGWGSGGGWNDGTRTVFPDSVQVNLNVSQAINEVAVYTLQDDFGSAPPVTEATTFTGYGITSFEVQYWNGSAFVPVPNGVVTGNNKVLRRFVFGTPITTDRVRVVVNGSADSLYSRVIEIEVFSCAPAVVPTPTPTPTPVATPTPCNAPSNNVARSTNGSTAVASSTYNANFPAGGVINGERDGNTWGVGSAWNDATRGVFPDNVQVNFNATQTIRQIDVYTLKNDFNSGSVVNNTTPATHYGITSFNVQYWNGAAFVDVPDGAVVGNTLAKRSFTFPDITTDRIRVVVNGSADSLYSRIVEIEAFSCTPVAVRCVNAVGEGGCHITIQGAINASPPNGQVNVRPGNYDEDVNVNKANLKLIGAGAGSTNIRGPIGGPGATVQITANNVTVAGFTVTRLGNNTTDWNNPGLNSAGFAIQGQAVTGALIRDNIITGNRNGLDINNTNGHTVRNNVIDFNRTGFIFRNQTDFMTVMENFITNNWTMGVLFLDASTGSNVPVQSARHSTFGNNNISANWYAQIVDRQTGGSLPAPGTTNYKNFRGNWYGTTSPVITTANSAETGYDDPGDGSRIPVAYGGSATPPGGQPDIAGPASANFQIVPFLQSGTDTNVETTPGRGTFGFQGVPNTVLVTPANQNGWVFFDDLPGTGTGTGGFESGPATPPLGTGSAFLTVDSQGRHALGVFSYQGTRMDDLLSMLYGSYQDNNSNTVVAPSLQFDIDYDLNDANTAYHGRLVFEPYLSPTQGAVQQNVWQAWDARNGNWYGTRTTVVSNNVSGVAQPCQPATPCTWQQVLTMFPNAGVRNTNLSAVLFKVGGPWAPGFDGNVDALSLSHNLNLIKYNFELTAPAAPATLRSTTVTRR